MPKLNYSWVTEPPITVFEGPSADRHIARYGPDLLQHIQAYRTGLTPTAGEPDTIRSLSTRNLDNAETMCGIVAGRSCVADQIFCVYKIGLHPVALMILSPFSDCVYISDLVVHPGAAAGGSIMIEFAFNYCVRKGIPTVLELWAFDEISVPAYLGMGFESNPKKPQDMSFDLTKGHAKWIRLKGKWRYLSSGYPGMMYTQGLMPPPPIPPKPGRAAPRRPAPRRKKTPPPLPPREKT